MNNLKISTRLTAGFLLLLVLICSLAAVGIWQLEVGKKLDQNVQHALKTERLIAEWEKTIALNTARTIAASRSESVATQQYFEAAMANASEHGVRVQKELRASLTEPATVDLYDAVQARRTEYRDARAAALKAKEAGDTQTSDRFFKQQMDGMIETYVGSVTALLNHQKQYMDQVRADAQQSSGFGRMVMITLAAVAVLISALLAFTLPRSITRPLQRAIGLAQTVASRDLTSVIKVDRRDETGDLLQALKQMNDSLMGVVSDVRGGAQAIASASDQILAGNRDLSSRTEEQASSLTETAAAMEQLTATVQQNADNAHQANMLASSAADVATRGGTIVAQVVTTMRDIHDSSQKVSDIIGVIDSIAFQTNILALNAAVEAARAGEQGKGFAVVAAEVRALAQRSATAAHEIKELIGASVSATDTGNRLVADAGTTMNEIVESVQRVTDIMGEITAASAEQSSGIQQVNQAVIEMDNTTQQNAALVEEAAAAAGSLQEQASRLAGVVATFKLSANASQELNTMQAAAPRKPPALGGRQSASLPVSVVPAPRKIGVADNTKALRSATPAAAATAQLANRRLMTAGAATATASASAIEEWEEF